MTQKFYNIQCTRCAGEGRYDRGTCFKCHGDRFTQQIRRPAGESLKFLATFDDGERFCWEFYRFHKIENAVEALKGCLRTLANRKKVGANYRMVRRPLSVEAA